MSDPAVAKSKRSIAKGQFTRAETRLNDCINVPDGQEDLPLSTCQRRFNEFSQKWQAVQDAHDSYIIYIAETIDEIQAGEEEKWLQELSDRFDKLEVKMDRFLEDRTVVKQNPVPLSVENKSPLNMLKFDRMKFPPFTGDIRKYPEFKEEFKQHIQSQCPKEQLAFVLKGYLTDEVREEVANVGDDYRKMWERLDQKYGNLGKLIDAILFQIKNLSLANADTNATLHMIKVVQKAHRDLEHLGEEAEMYNSTTISMIEERMSMAIKHEWVKLVASKPLTSRHKFKLLLELLEDWQCRLEYVSNDIRVLPNQRGLVNFLNEQNNGGFTNMSNKRRHGCWLHNLDGEAGEHPVWRCREFLSRSVGERIQLAIQNNACQVCLLKQCPGVSDPCNCQSNFRCRTNGCGKSHNRLLHLESTNAPALNAHVSDGSTILPVQQI